MAQGYIRIYPTGTSSEAGFKLNCEIVNTFSHTSGVETLDLTVPGVEGRVFFPISGLVKDPTFTLQLMDTNENKAFQITSGGTEIPLSIVTIKEQINFWIDNMSSSLLGAEYGVYFEFLDREFVGTAKPILEVNEQDYFSIANIQIQLKVGGNIF